MCPGPAELGAFNPDAVTWQAERRSSSAQVMNGGADRRDRAVDVPSLTAAPDRDARTKRPRVPPAGGRHDWNKYDQGQVVYRPAQMSGDELRLGQLRAYETFYSLPSIAGRFRILGGRHRAQWLLYNMFMRRGAATEQIDPIAVPTPAADTSPMPPIMARQT